MSRSLHITIHESSSAEPLRATVYPARTAIDSDSFYVMSNDPTDPQDEPVKPRADDPSGPPVFRAAIPNGGGATVATIGYAPSVYDGGTTPGISSFVRPRDYSGFVIVRMASDIDNSVAEDLWGLAHHYKLSGLKAVLELPVKADEDPERGLWGLIDRLLSGLSENDGEPPKGTLASRSLIARRERDAGAHCHKDLLLEKEKEAATTAFPPLHSLTSYWRLDLREHPDLVEKVVARLNLLPEVDLAYRELIAADPQSPVTPDQPFSEDQGYFKDAPLGTGVSWAWPQLNGSRKVTLCDLEQGWNTDHEQLKERIERSPIHGDNRGREKNSDGHHGTAVLGQLIAGSDGDSQSKANDSKGRFVLVSHYQKEGTDGSKRTNGHVADAIKQALTETTAAGGPLQKGDVLLLEVERGRLPTEVDEADFDAIRLASALGIIVIEAAGNGGFDLDRYVDPETGRSLRRDHPRFRDSGAILVGAARAGLPHDRMPFSNYGSRVDCFSWGEAVTTCGYGDLSGTDVTDFYTNTFSGTSSASPVIARVAALVQDLHLAKADHYLRPQAIRELLSDPATGTRQGPNVPGPIGVMPDLKAIVRGKLQIVPDVYMRRRVGDDGSAPGLDESISSSPDILVCKRVPAGEGREANAEAPGDPIDPRDPKALYTGGCPQLYVRLRNRGMDEGEAHVQLFASPAATLITPECWLPLHPSPIEISGIKQGDTPELSALPIALSKLQEWPLPVSKWQPDISPDRVPAYSFLAVQVEAPSASFPPVSAPAAILPPGPPYFDWAEFRSFLRGRGVAWRNIHPVKVSGDMTLAFLFAGTPDQTRRFDFEVIQRLPADVEVTLQVSNPLAAKLRQGQPWCPEHDLDKSMSLVDLVLPKRPRMTMSRVALAPGVYERAFFHVAGSGNLHNGHSLAIRQLWHGEEVGRITWCFVNR